MLKHDFSDSTSTEPILYRYERHAEHENENNKLARPHSTYTIMNNDNDAVAVVGPSINHQRSMTDLTNEHAATSTTTKASSTQRRRAFAQSLSANVLQKGGVFRRLFSQTSNSSNGTAGATGVIARRQVRFVFMLLIL